MTSTRDTELQLSELFDRPSSPVRAKVFICATGRTGSSLLCRAMFHHGIGLPHEYFNAGHIALIGQRSGIHALTDGSRLGSDSEARRAYIAALMDRRTANGIFAAKIHWGQYATYLDNPEGVEMFQQAHFIHLYREDLLAQAISFHVARETGRWGSDGTASTPPASVPRFFDVDLIADYMKALAESDTCWRLFFARNAISPLTVSYERVGDDVAGVLRTIVDRFGLDLPTGCFDYVEEGPTEARDAQVPSRSEMKARFLRGHQRVIPALRGDALRTASDMNPVEVESPRAAPPHVAANARFAADKLPESKAPDLGTLGVENMVEQHKLVPTRRLRSRVIGPPRVLVAILAQQKEPALPLYLECIEALDYPKSSIVLYIHTNNNTDRTEPILRDWVARVGHLYAAVDFDASDVADRVEQFREHEWNATRFKVLGQIRNASLRRALDLGCDFYFVADVDNFIRPATLRELVALDLPMVAPLLRSIIPERFYSNYHAEIDAAGYYKNCDQYYWILNRHVRGIVEVPVVNCTYLVRADAIPELTYEEESDRHEYVIFSDSARRAGIPQYLDNRQVYGYIALSEGEQHLGGEIQRARALLQGAGDRTCCENDGEIAGPPSGDAPLIHALPTPEPRTYSKVAWEANLAEELRFWRVWLTEPRFAKDRDYRLSSRHPFKQHLLQFLPQGQDTYAVLDVGSGPVSDFGLGGLDKIINLYMVDPLASEYNALLNELRLCNAVRPINVAGEDLTKAFPNSFFDLVHCSNALDHSCDPMRVIREMIAVCKPGCWTHLSHVNNVAVIESYHGLHQWNLDIEDGRFVVWNREERHDVVAEIDGISEVLLEQLPADQYRPPLFRAALRK